MQLSNPDVVTINERCNELLTGMTHMRERIGNLLQVVKSDAMKAHLTALLCEIAEARQRVVEIKSYI